MMEDAGAESLVMQIVCSMIVGMFRVLMVIVGTLLVDDPSWGRRSLLLFSVAGVTLTKATLSLSEILPPEYHPECALPPPSPSAHPPLRSSSSTLECPQHSKRVLVRGTDGHKRRGFDFQGEPSCRWWGTLAFCRWGWAP
jgi:hypothetical protein